MHERAEVALKPGGLFILEAFHHSQLKYQSGGPKTTDLLYDLDALLDDFQTLQILEAFDGLCYLDEGARHSGIGHIVRLVLQKTKAVRSPIRLQQLFQAKHSQRITNLMRKTALFSTVIIVLIATWLTAMKHSIHERIA